MRSFVKEKKKKNCLYNLSERHTLNLFDVIHLKRAYKLLSSISHDKTTQITLNPWPICRVNNIVFSEAFWFTIPLEFSRFVRFSECCALKAVKIIGIAATKRSILLINLYFGDIFIVVGFRVRACYYLLISLYFRNCSRHDAVFR